MAATAPSSTSEAISLRASREYKNYVNGVVTTGNVPGEGQP